MRHGSLFSGIGGFDLAAEWMGWENMFHCEWNEFGQRHLKYYWPNATSYGDITTTDFTIWRGKIDILTGGFPCQPYSTAGKRKGKEDARHLWPEKLRAIREIQPRYVVGENVRGLTNWNGGMVFDEVQAELEAEGYEVLPFLLPACAVNAPHRRDRIWFVAHSISNGHRNESGKGGCAENRKQGEEQREKRNEIFRERDGNNVERIVFERDAADTANIRYESPGRTRTRRTGFANSDFKHYASNPNSQQRCERRMYAPGPYSAKRHIGSRNAPHHKRTAWQNFPTQPPVCSGNDGLSPELDGITFSKWRNESIKAAGNAIVPQVAYQIFKAIETTNETF